MYSYLRRRPPDSEQYTAPNPSEAIARVSVVHGAEPQQTGYGDHGEEMHDLNVKEGHGVARDPPLTTRVCPLRGYDNVRCANEFWER
jgi:hypothetical protein